MVSGTGGFLKRCVLIFLMIFLPGVCMARTLHVGDASCTLSQTKQTTPALNVQIGDDRFYANLNKCDTPLSQTTATRMVVENKDNKWENYYVSDFVPADANNYLVIDGRLVWADCDIYLQSGGLAYIRTNYTANPNTRVWADFQLNSTAGQQWVFGQFTSDGNLCFSMYAGTNGSPGRWAQCSYNNSIGRGNISSTNVDTNRHQVVLSAKRHVEYFANATVTFDTTGSSTTNGVAPIGIFSNYYGQKNSNMRLYALKVWNGDTIVHHFVPVPHGLQIGDFTVPENGLFDIVEQQFYGNAGGGMFAINLPRAGHWENLGLYTYDANGNLIDADSDVFLESDGLEYINTTYTVNPSTKIYADYQMNSTMGQQYMFGRWGGSGTNNQLCMAAYVNGKEGASGNWAECSYNLSSGSGHASSTAADTNRHQLMLSVQNHVEYWTGATFASISKTSTQNGPGPIGIFSSYGGGKKSNMRLFRLKIWENDTLVHDFIPVPTGLVINDFTAPSNGLFDVVEQQFYGNNGSGAFAFGY